MYLTIVITLGLALISAILAVVGNKTTIGLIIMIFGAMLFVAGVSNIGVVKMNKYMLSFIVVTIPFPYLIRFEGRDALTITTILIYFIFMFVLLGDLVKKKINLKLQFEIILPVLLFVSFTFSLLLNPLFFGESFRYYVANCSGVLLYFIILALIKRQSEVVIVVKIVLFTLVIQSIISVLQIKFPAISRYFFVFARRADDLGARSVQGILRATGTVGDYELLSEWFVIGAILSIMLIYVTRRYVYFLPILCCSVGILLTKTRSALLLFAFSFILITVLLNLFKKDRNALSLKITLSIIAACGILYFVLSDQVDEITQRLRSISVTSGVSAESFHREGAWTMALEYIGTPTIVGKGLCTIQTLHPDLKVGGGFHSLYLTMLYRIGVFGILIHILFWFKILQKSWSFLINMKESKRWYTVFFLTISTVIMLINEIKIDYLRYGHTIQFAWVIYALLVVSLRQSEEVDENTVVSTVTI